MDDQPAIRNRPRSLSVEAVRRQSELILGGTWPAGRKLPTEADLIREYQVSRPVIREALSRLQASGLVVTRHGVGTFVAQDELLPSFRIAPNEKATLEDVIAVLELRIAIESEAAGVAAERRTAEYLAAMQSALKAFEDAMNAGTDTVEADFRFHLEISRANMNRRFVDLSTSMGGRMIPRARLQFVDVPAPKPLHYLQLVNVENHHIFAAVERGDVESARSAMRAHLENSLKRRRQSDVSSPPGWHHQPSLKSSFGLSYRQIAIRLASKRSVTKPLPAWRSPLHAPVNGAEASRWPQPAPRRSSR